MLKYKLPYYETHNSPVMKGGKNCEKLQQIWGCQKMKQLKLERTTA